MATAAAFTPSVSRAQAPYLSADPSHRTYPSSLSSTRFDARMRHVRGSLPLLAAWQTHLSADLFHLLFAQSQRFAQGKFLALCGEKE